MSSHTIKFEIIERQVYCNQCKRPFLVRIRTVTSWASNYDPKLRVTTTCPLCDYVNIIPLYDFVHKETDVFVFR